MLLLLQSERDGRLKVDDDKIASASSSSVSLSTSSSRRGSFSGKIGGKRVFQWEYDPSDLIKVCSFLQIGRAHV